MREAKKREREQKKKEKEQAKSLRKKKRSRYDRIVSSSEDDSSIEDMPGSDVDSGSEPINPSQCYRCQGLEDGIPSNWIGCNRCPRWLHRSCVTSIDFFSMSETEIENMYFECDYC